MKKNHWPTLAAALALPPCTGAIGAFFTKESVTTWYPALLKPPLTPPSWVFAPVWTLLYILMGLAFYLVLISDAERTKRKLAISLFCAHLGVNVLWSFLFFGLRNPFWALVDIAVLWIMIAFLLRIFSRINRLAATMLLPYFLWVSFASFLNYAIWRMN